MWLAFGSSHFPVPMHTPDIGLPGFDVPRHVDIRGDAKADQYVGEFLPQLADHGRNDGVPDGRYCADRELTKLLFPQLVGEIDYLLQPQKRLLHLRHQGMGFFRGFDGASALCE
jgi:hypothetical protein